MHEPNGNQSPNAIVFQVTAPKYRLRLFMFSTLHYMLGHCKCSSSLLRKGIKKKVTPGSTKWGTAETAIHGGEYIFRKAVVETKLDQLRCDVGSTYHGLERSFFFGDI